VNKKAQIKVALKRYLNTHSFYSAEEFLMYKDDPIFVNSIRYLMYMYGFSITLVAFGGLVLLDPRFMVQTRQKMMDF
jgi:hypothetical protein